MKVYLILMYFTKDDEEPNGETGLSSLHKKDTLQLSTQQKQTFTKKKKFRHFS